MADPTDPAEPTALSLITDLTAQLAQMTRVVLEHTATIVAVLAYLREQPACDVARLAALQTEARARLKLPPRPEDLDATMLALLRDFEGPPQ